MTRLVYLRPQSPPKSLVVHDHGHLGDLVLCLRGTADDPGLLANGNGAADLEGVGRLAALVVGVEELMQAEAGVRMELVPSQDKLWARAHFTSVSQKNKMKDAPIVSLP